MCNSLKRAFTRAERNGGRGRVKGFFFVSFKPSQPQRIISGLSESFIMRYIVEWTNKAKIRAEEHAKLLLTVTAGEKKAPNKI